MNRVYKYSLSPYPALPLSVPLQLVKQVRQHRCALVCSPSPGQALLPVVSEGDGEEVAQPVAAAAT